MLGFVLGPMMEENFRRAMVLSRRRRIGLHPQPISLGFLMLAAVMLVLASLPKIRRQRNAVATEEA